MEADRRELIIRERPACSRVIVLTKRTDMPKQSLQRSGERQDKAHVLTLLHALHHFLKSHPEARITSAPRLICGNPSQLFPWVGCAGRHGFLSSMRVAQPAA
jgi:hypothetical protein